MRPILFLGRSTGIVTTARITHATPAAAFAHTAHRDWEEDGFMRDDDVTGNCKDIAYQLVMENYKIQVKDFLVYGQKGN